MLHLSSSLAMRILQTVRLPEPWPSRVQGGVPGIGLDELREVLPQRLEAGAALRLIDAAANPLGLGLYDPENHLLRTMPAWATETLDEAFFARRIARALELRRGAGLLTADGACRLVNAEGDGLAGFVADGWGPWVVCHTFATALERWLDPFAAALDQALTPQGVMGKVRLPGGPREGTAPWRLLAGAAPPRALWVHEAGVAYEVHLTGGLNCGLFPELREVRAAVGRWAAGRRVLNLFSYTGGFSLVAARGGAAQVTTVDASSGVLEWARANFRANQLDPDDDRWRFIRADAFEALEAARTAGERWELLVIDPPAVGCAEGGRFYLESDYGRLVTAALHVAAEGALLIASAQSVQSRPERLERQIREGARAAGRRLALVESFALPADFPTMLIHPAARTLKCQLLQVD
jgi:23S rRNA (cytosine1962-C5)-methyltransferase